MDPLPNTIQPAWIYLIAIMDPLLPYGGIVMVAI